MSQNLNPSSMVVSPAPTPGATDAYFDAVITYSLGSAVAQVVPVGLYWFLANAHAKLQVQIDSTGTNWNDVYPLSTGGLVLSDGGNVRLLADSTGSSSVQLLPKM